MRVAIGCLDLRRLPGHNEALNNQLLFGEEVILYDEADGWAWVQSRTDRYVGYVERSGLAEDIQSNTHSLTALRTFLYPEPDLKKPRRQVRWAPQTRPEQKRLELSPRVDPPPHRAGW